MKKEETVSSSKEEEKITIRPDATMQSNIDDLAEHFKHLELQLGEGARHVSPTQPPMIATQSVIYCIMCGTQGHGICDCTELKYFLAQGICCLDLNNCIVMMDGSTLPCVEGAGGVARVIKERMRRNMPSGMGLTSNSALVEVVAENTCY